MKKLMMSFAASFLITAISFAQPAPQQDGASKYFRPGHEHHIPLAKLNLTDGQKQQIKQVNSNFKQQMQTLNNNENITVKEQRDQRAAIEKSRKDAMMAILTADQKNQMATIRKQNKQKHAEMSAKRLNKMKTQLGLSDDQIAQIKINQAATQAKMKAIMENKNADQPSKREQLMALRKEMKNNIGSVLTDDQKAKMKNMHQEHSKRSMHENEQENTQTNVK